MWTSHGLQLELLNQLGFHQAFMKDTARRLCAVHKAWHLSKPGMLVRAQCCMLSVIDWIMQSRNVLQAELVLNCFKVSIASLAIHGAGEIMECNGAGRAAATL